MRLALVLAAAVAACSSGSRTSSISGTPGQTHPIDAAPIVVAPVDAAPIDAQTWRWDAAWTPPDAAPAIHWDAAVVPVRWDAAVAPVRWDAAVAHAPIGSPGHADTECHGDGDCMVYCPSAPGCCSSAPCGCQQAILRSERATIDREFKASCQKAPHCVDVDCRYDQADGAQCVGGRCVARRGPPGSAPELPPAAAGPPPPP